MLFERIESSGLAHYSYIMGDENEAVVIDPRRDADDYIEAARQAGMQIKYVLETHRNEDYLIGSLKIARQTGAKIFHSFNEGYDFEYGEDIQDGDKITFGNLTIEALHTPGHTMGHMSYLLYDDEDNPWIIFTGDALFAGDVGRTDFYEGKNEEMTGKLYDSLHNKILPLGDGVIICAAHGAGSVCGSNITERIWTSIGLERKYNPALQIENRDDFIDEFSNPHDKPPYFKTMEKFNKIGPEDKSLPVPAALSPQEFMEAAEQGQVVDIRSESCFGSSFVPGSIFIKEEVLSNFAGWFLSYDKPILLVSDSDNIKPAVKQLFRLGYDNIAGYLKGGITSWTKAGYKTSSIATADAIDIKEMEQTGKNPFILDIRDKDEALQTPIPSSLRIKLTDLPDKFDEVPGAKNLNIVCGSGVRSMIAASLLKRAGFDNLSVPLGGISGWKS